LSQVLPHLAPPALALGIDHRSSELLRQQPGGLVCDTELDSASSNTPYLVYLGEHLLSGFLPPLHRDGTAQRIHHTAELYEQAVAGGLHEPAIVLGHLKID
jgi:hypothetical protein